MTKENKKNYRNKSSEHISYYFLKCFGYLSWVWCRQGRAKSIHKSGRHIMMQLLTVQWLALEMHYKELLLLKLLFHINAQFLAILWNLSITQDHPNFGYQIKDYFQRN